MHNHPHRFKFAYTFFNNGTLAPITTRQSFIEYSVDDLADTSKTTYISILPLFRLTTGYLVPTRTLF